MIHYATPQRSDDPATLPVADPASPQGSPASTDAPPGPISWELTVRQPAGPDAEPTSPGDSSWDAVPHPVGPIAEPPRPQGSAAPAGAGDPEPASRRRRFPAPVEEPAAPEPLVATTVHHLGPVGRRRSPVLAFALAVATLGIQPIAWTRRTNAEMAHFDPRMVVRPGRAAAAVAVATLLPLVAALAAGARIVADHLGSSPTLPVSPDLTRWLVLAPAAAPVLAVLLPLSLVAMTMTLERIRVVEDRAGLDPELQLHPSAAVWWAAVPGIGLALVVARAQRRLNRVWEACTAAERR